MAKLMSVLKDVKNLFDEICKFLDQYDPERKFKFTDKEFHSKFIELREKFRELFINLLIGNELNECYLWINYLKEVIESVIKIHGLNMIILSKELRSFVENPIDHLKKKIFNYMYDLFRKKISFEEFIQKAAPAVKTSFRTNMRTIYQDWVFLSILKILGNEGCKLVYPDYGVLSLERHGRQKLGFIPPNAVVKLTNSGYVSFFIEAPRPITWEDTSDLVKVWKLYTALRPDMMIYGEAIYNIVQIDQDPPIKKPNLIIECKELSDWYERVRYVRGPFAKPLTAEEWRSKWITGLYQGLADVLGIQYGEAKKLVEEKKTIKLTDQQIVMLYKSVYKPDNMLVISRARVPSYVKSKLEDHGITIIDDVRFEHNRLKEAINYLYKIATSKTSGFEIDKEFEKFLNELQQILSLKLNIELSRTEIINYITQYMKKEIDEFINYVKSKLNS